MRVSTMRNEMSSVDRAIESAGFGLYHHFVIALASLCSFSDALIMTTMPFVISLMACDIPLSGNMILSINVALNIGAAAGGFMFCALSDVFGRKYMIPILAGFIFASTLACSFVHGTLFLFIFAVCLGSGLGANSSVMKIYMGEMLPMRRRGFCMMVPDIFWSMGYYVAITIAWLFSPLAIRYYNKDARFFTWRIMCAISSVFSIVVGCVSNLLKPSVRYLLYCKRHGEALNALKAIYAINKSKTSEDFDVKEEHLFGQIRDYGINRNFPMRVYFEHVCSLMRTINRAVAQVTNRQFLKRFVILASLKMVTLCGIFVTNMWLYKTLDRGGNCRITGLDVLHLEVPTKSNSCDLKMQSSAYRDFVCLGLSVIVGQMLLVFLVEKIERKYLILSSGLLCGICSLTLAFIGNVEIQMLKITLSSMFLACYSVMDSVINIVIVEVFPTALRGTAAGEAQFFARIACLFLKKYLSLPCQLSFILAGTFMEVAAVLAFFLPEFNGRPMME